TGVNTEAVVAESDDKPGHGIGPVGGAVLRYGRCRCPVGRQGEPAALVCGGDRCGAVADAALGVEVGEVRLDGASLMKSSPTISGCPA
ncbi:MAG: hypothetical protein M0026_22020, partial [Nocardiopsaceae bacterium]|nr:hypothetical protein [Nocardiopsaceae bacterium]